MRLAVFCGSRTGSNPVYAEQGALLAKTFASESVTAIYGGSCVGMMGVFAQSILDSGGEIVGVSVESLFEFESLHTGLTELHEVDDLHRRKALMAEMSDGFIALPGGPGTLDEFFDIWTWSSLGLHDKPIGLFNVNGYFDPMLKMFDHMKDEGFFSSYDSLIIEEDPELLIKRFLRTRN